MGSLRQFVEREVSSRPEVETRPRRFRGVEFRVRGHEIGRLDGDRVADLPFPVRMREELVAEGKAQPHHLLPQTGWVSLYPRGLEDTSAAVKRFRLYYDRLMKRGRGQVNQHASAEGEEAR